MHSGFIPAPAWRPLLALLGIWWLAACAGPTPYQAAVLPDDFGYREQRLGDNRFRVSFVGNQFTSAETVDSYLLYRAAELCRDLGYDYFLITARQLAPAVDRGGIGVYPSVGYYGGFGGDGLGVGIGIGGGSFQSLGYYRGMADILMGRGRPPADGRNAYEAQDILKYLAPVVGTSVVETAAIQ